MKDTPTWIRLLDDIQTRSSQTHDMDPDDMVKALNEIYDLADDLFRVIDEMLDDLAFGVKYEIERYMGR